jgi:isopentenyl-diphosphate delta-isomerase type 1
MVEEWFDVVDEQDRVVGRRLRADVHRLGLVHRAVHVFVFNRSGQVFLQKRSQSKDAWPGAWDTSASGHVDSGEDYDTAARREIGEELGIHDPEAIEPLFKIDACAESGQEFFWVYRTHWDGPVKLHPEEIETGEWLTTEEIGKRIQAAPGDYASSFRLAWAEMRRRGLV